MKKPLGVRTKMILYFVIFTAVILLVIAAFETLLLDSIYRSTVRRQTKDAVEKIAKTEYTDPDFESNMYTVAAESGICVSVYRAGSWDMPVLHAHTRSYCVIHRSDLAKVMSNTYKQCKTDGSYSETVTENKSSGEGGFIYAKTVSFKKTDLMIVAYASIQPVGATVSAIRYQLLYISAILLLLSAVMAIVISRKFAAPLVSMNEEAKKLAIGNYGVEFRGGTFKETAELGSTLNYAANELSKLDTMQKELISNISHDLRTPLTLISGYSEVMRDIPGEMTASNMQIIIDETNRLSSLVSDMLDLSRLSGGKRELNTSVFSLTEVIHRTVQRFSHLCEKDGYTISFLYDREVYVEADETLILQVIYNLISNAVNYTGDDKKVYIYQTVSGSCCRISVSDTGEGIPEEKLPLIWDRYYRTGDYHKRGITGTGLGLSIVKNALVLHGAPFGVSSTVGVGSTFWFDLQLYDNTDSEASHLPR